jgi:hypothetical protein
MRMWVHRLSVGEAGTPTAAVDYSDVEADLLEVAREVRKDPLDLDEAYTAAEEYLRAELLERNFLRQGWGAPGMDVRRERQFKKSYVIAMRRYWKSFPAAVLEELRSASGEPYKIFQAIQPLYEEAAGRLRVLQRMNEMSRDDVVFLPNVPEPGNTFTVVRVATPYEFDERDPAAARAIWEIDFGHRRGVKDVRTFPYGKDTLEPGIFGPPYRHAIDPVRSREQQLRDFVHRVFER